MIFMPGIEIGERIETSMKFLIGGSLYFLQHDWEMEVLNLTTFQMETAVVHADDSNSLLDLYETVVVHNEIAYVWNYEDMILYEGRKKQDGFHWNSKVTTGDAPTLGISFEYNCGSNSYLCVIAQEDLANSHYLYRLNFEKMEWTKQELHFRGDITDAIDNQPLRSIYWDVWSIGHIVHFLSHHNHLILDLTTLEFILECDKYGTDDVTRQCSSAFFSDNRSLWLIGNNSSRGKPALYRYEMPTMKWTKMGHTGNECRFGSERPITEGTRIFFLNKDFDRNNPEIRKVKILELNPTLFDRAAVVLAQDPVRARLEHMILPKNITEELFARRFLVCKEEMQKNEIEEDEDIDDCEGSYIGNEDEEIPHKRNRLV